MELELGLYRHNKTLDYTEGELFHENIKERLCDSLEDKLRNKGEKKVYGKHAIPAGRYPIEIRFSPKFGCETIHILNVPEYDYILMHWGATALNTDGCVLCGERQEPGRLMNIGMTKKLVELLRSYGGTGFLTIKD